jgi:hypothetical protein
MVQFGHGAWPRQAGGVPTASRAATHVGGTALFEQGAPGAADALVAAGSGRGREERGAGAHGLTRRKREVGRARMNNDDF